MDHPQISQCLGSDTLNVLVFMKIFYSNHHTFTLRMFNRSPSDLLGTPLDEGGGGGTGYIPVIRGSTCTGHQYYSLTISCATVLAALTLDQIRCRPINTAVGTTRSAVCGFRKCQGHGGKLAGFIRWELIK